MQVELRDWQIRLDKHFKELREDRSVNAPDRPIFGLEHGLVDHEFNDLSKAIRAHISDRPPCWDHRLAWMVYATEFGYVYAGDEYWQTFEEHTPGWDIHGDRYWIRKCFFDFHKHFGGAKPSGPWAQHFSIICWPITHAILPTDLQRHLARILFDLRHVFSSETLTSPRQLGELIAARSWDTPSRFQQLAQEPLFLGQIAAALLLQGDRIASSLILASTLGRIGKDLDRERRARTWLRSARESAQQRLRFQCITGSGVGRESRERSIEETANLSGALSLEPRLVLRSSEEGGWNLLLEVPDLSHIPARFPQLKDVLLNSRCHVVGSSGRPLARGRLLYGPQQILLREWPGTDKPLLKFEQSSPDLEYLLQADCLLRPGPIWLFKIASDGLAYELRSAHVRAGQKYILLLERERHVADHPSIVQTTVRCDGVHALSLNLPEAMTPELDEALETLGVHQAATIQIWPAGITPVRWDGEGAAEWLSTDKPCLGIRADRHVESFSLDLDFRTMNVVPSYPGAPVFVELPALDTGLHTLRVSANTVNGETAGELGNLEIMIREPRVWVPGRNSQSALLVVVDPNAPTLEQLWEGQIEIELYGPTSRKVKCVISLFMKGHSQPHLCKILPGLRLPVNNTVWQEYLDRHFKKRKDVQNAYDLADSCVLIFHADELGVFTLTAEREFSPLRWAVLRTRDRYFLRLLDDIGTEEMPRILFHEFKTPDIEHHLDPAAINSGDGFEAIGGLYIAKSGDYQRSVIIPPEVHTFKDLRIEPQLTPYRRTSQDVIKLVNILDLWTGARLTGNLLSIMRREILLTILREIFHLICGERWTKIELVLSQENGEQVLQVTKNTLSNKPEEVSLAAKLHGEIDELRISSPAERAERLAHLAERFLRLPSDPGDVTDGPTKLTWMAKFVLRLASCSRSITDWAGNNLPSAILHLLEIPGLARSARFMVLMLACEREHSSLSSRQLYEGWDWQ
jgi:hypothetical protein